MTLPLAGVVIALLTRRALVKSAGGEHLVAALLIGAGTGSAASSRQAGSCAARWVGGPQVAVVAVHDRPSRRGLTTGTVVHTRAGCDGDLRLRFDSAVIVPGGVRAIIVGTYRPPLVLRVTHVRILDQRRSWRYAVRDAVGARVQQLYGPRAPLVEALVTGRREDLDRTLQDDFTASGLAHLLSISGLHVGIMAGWLVMVLKRFLPRRNVLAISTAISWGYVILLGCPAPATRTAGFLTVNAASRWWQRHPPTGVVLSVSVLLILAIDPLAMTSVGAWLSVAAVWGTTAAGEALPDIHRKSAVKQLIAASVGATIVTAPITAYTFGAMAPIGIVANLVAVPVSGVAVPAVFFSLFAGEWMASGAGLALAAVERTASLAARIPGGHFNAEPGIGFAWPWAVLLGAALWARHRRPAWIVARRRLLLAGVTATWGAAVATALPSRHAPVEIRVLDVGQGDAIAIRTPRGHWALVDAGPRTPRRDAGRDVVVPFFRRAGVRRLDLLIATHADADHLGGVPAVLRELDPVMVLENGQAAGTDLFLEHLAVIDAAGISWHVARAGDTVRIDSVTLAVLHPASTWVDTHMETNENSVVVRLTYGDFDAILTGDIGFPAESALAGIVGEAEVLKVGHHGSAGSSAASWVAAVRPRLAVISVGADNRYGHPAPAALARLSSAGAAVWRTDRGGTVTIGTDGRTFWVEQQRQRTFSERIRCRLATWLPSSDSLSSRSGCTAGQRVSYPTFSTTSRSPPR